MSGPRRRVVLVDDHEMVRAGLKSMLSRFPDDVRVVGEAATAAEGFSVVTGLLPDVVLTDVRIGADSGLDLCRRLTAAQCVSRVLFLTVYDDEQYLFQALRAGASGYVLKSVADRDLVEACRATMRGEPFLYPDAVRALMREHLEQAVRGEDAPEDPLSSREGEVLKLVAEGNSTREIAEVLVISPKTVERHRAAILEKLGMRDRVDLTRYAIRRGLVEP